MWGQARHPHLDPSLMFDSSLWEGTLRQTSSHPMWKRMPLVTFYFVRQLSFKVKRKKNFFLLINLYIWGPEMLYKWICTNQPPNFLTKVTCFNFLLSPLYTMFYRKRPQLFLSPRAVFTGFSNLQLYFSNFNLIDWNMYGFLQVFWRSFYFSSSSYFMPQRSKFDFYVWCNDFIFE